MPLSFVKTICCINQTTTNTGCVAVHFHDVASPLGDMNDFIFSQILGESVEWIKYLTKNPAQESEITVYLATGISSNRYIRIQRSFLENDITPAKLLSHFPTKKPLQCIVEFDRVEIPSEEAGVPDKKPLENPEPKAEVRRKRSRSMMRVWCSTVDLKYF
jgi:hypothetical protein